MRVLLVSVLLGAAVSVPATASPVVRVVPGSPACGGLTLVAGPEHLSCVHPGRYDGPVSAGALPPATAPVACYGDGTTGPRVQLFYGYVAGRANNAAAVTQAVRRQTAPRMQAVVTAQAGGKDLGIRFAFDSGCGTLSVPVVRLPVGAERGTPEARFGVVIETLRALGYTRSDRKYQVILDGSTTDGTCGLGELAATMDQRHPANVHDGGPTVGARTDVGGAAPVTLPRYSVVWRSTFGPRGPSCWEMGQSHAAAQVHELFHTLGAVQLSAPHSDGGGHCTDTPSIMCPTRGKPIVRGCASRPVEVLDCGLDDYWNPAPAPGSYLDGADNIATSVFFGPQPQDRLAASPV